MKKVNVGLVGTGFLSDIFARCYTHDPKVKLATVCSRTEENARSFAHKYGLKTWYTDYNAMLRRDDLDAVNICVPNFLHAPLTISAAENGKHVLCTKPLAISMEEAEKMVRTCENAGVKLMYGENWLFTPAAGRIQEIIDEGALGKILAIEAREQHSGSHSPYATKREYCGGGVLIHMAVHPIGFILSIMNRPVKRVYAELGNLLHNLEVEDYAVILIRFEGEGSGVAQSNYITKGGMQERIEIYGSEGMVFMNLTHENPMRVYSDVGYSYVVEKASLSHGWTSPVIDEKTHYGFCNMVRHFSDCILEDKEPLSDGKFGKEVLKVIFAGYESNKKKTSINLV